MLLDIQDYYGKLSRKEALSEDEVVDLLKELRHFRNATAYLATCHSATLESMPKSASKSSRARHVKICEDAAALLGGDSSIVRTKSTHMVDPEYISKRCLEAVAAHRNA